MRRSAPLSMKWIRLVAAQGEVHAQLYLGLMYEGGTDVPQDYKEALKWYHFAARQGNALAQFSLGRMYEEGKGVPQDYAEALKWYRLAAAQGYAGAQYDLGVMYANGQGVPQDYVQAYLWYYLAASHLTDPDRSEENLATVAAKMTPAQLAEAQKLAREWKPTPPGK